MPTGIYERKIISKRILKCCETCKKTFLAYPSDVGRFCGWNCLWQANKNYRHSDEAKKKIAARRGWKHTEETRRKISEMKKGEKAYQWKGGVTKEHKAIRQSIEFRLWREAVFARDNWICQKHQIREHTLHPHHIQNFAEYPELRFVTDNGITLCEKAHREFHKRYGSKNNTKKQINEFINGR